MRKLQKLYFFAAVVVLLGLFGCGESMPESEPKWFSPPETTPEGETVAWPESIPLSEIDPILGPGPFSINELAERFGEPEELIVNPATGWIVTLNVCGFELILETDQPYYEIDPEQIDRSLPMKVYRVQVHGNDLPLPRGIRIGDSYKEVRKAYSETPYSGGHRWDGTAELFYRYEGEAPGEYGIWYNFGGDQLSYVTIIWLDLYA